MNKVEHQDRIAALIKGWVWFQELPDEAHDWLLNKGTIVEHKRGQLVYAHEAPVTHIYGILEGGYRIFLVSLEGDEITLGEEAAGAWNPHFVPGENPTYFGNCTCAKDAICVAYSLKTMEEFGRRWPLYYKGQYIEFLSRANTIAGRIELLSLHTLDVRLAVYILRLAKLRGEALADGSIFIPQIESQTEIGARVGGTRQRINALLNSWTKRGIIKPEKGGISLLNRGLMSAEAEKTGFDLSAYLDGWQGGWAPAKPAK